MVISYEPDNLGEVERRILEERARRLAQPPEVPATGEAIDLVVLVLGVERYGIAVRFVQEVQPLDDVTPLPGVPAFWAGMVALRGHLYPLLNLRSYLGLPASSSGRSPTVPANKEAGAAGLGKVALVAALGMEIGLLADDVLEVRQVLKAEIGPALIEPTGPARVLTMGVTSDLLSVLNLEALLGDPRLIVQSE
jgi:purine-binding chemotaxis protein CheW